MRIIVIGGKGTIGSAVVKALSKEHEVLVASRNEADLTCDITSEESLKDMFKSAGIFHAVVIATGYVTFEDFDKMDAKKYYSSIQNKLMGQLNAVLIGREWIQDKGSFTLTSGILSHVPIRMGTAASMVNKAIEGFVMASAIEMQRQIRINAVSPTILEESVKKYGAYFRGFETVPASKVAMAYLRSIEGLQTGQIFEVLN